MGGDDEIEVELRDMCTAEREQVRQTWLKLEGVRKKFEPKIMVYDPYDPIWHLRQANITPVDQPMDIDFDEPLKNLAKKSMSCKMDIDFDERLKNLAKRSMNCK